AGRAGPVEEDAEEPRLERRPPLEALEAPHHRQPRVLDGLLGDRPAPDGALGQAQEPDLVALHQRRERGLVTRPQTVEEVGVGVGLHRDAGYEHLLSSPAMGAWRYRAGRCRSSLTPRTGRG